MNPTKLPSGSWRLKVYLGKDESGKRIYQSVTNVNKRECIRIANELAQHHREITRNPAMMTLGEAIDKYIKMKDGVLSPATIRGYDNIRRNHLQPEMNMQIKNINNHVAQAAINREAKSNSPKTVANVYGLLKTVVGQFTITKLNVTLPQSEDFEGNQLTKEQCGILVKALEGDSAEIPILLALFLGLRRSEIMALEYSDWDSSTNTLKISKAKVPDKNGHFIQKTTKTKKSKRTLQVPDYLAAKLNQCEAEGKRFCTIHPSAVSRHLTDICDKMNLPHMRLHDLRHQNASIMLSLGTPDKYAMERGGWSSITTMKKIYQHTMDAKREEVNSNMDKYFSEIVSSTTTCTTEL